MPIRIKTNPNWIKLWFDLTESQPCNEIIGFHIIIQKDGDFLYGLLIEHQNEWINIGIIKRRDCWSTRHPKLLIFATSSEYAETVLTILSVALQ